eukprot:TRINITY_DN47636_c0_g1_i1.p1 TRINITY_DN47636_c0_g1~~TRINITY_DN47636_c0_g1_i1.p1  ORF type:complete len:301 (+),score=43.84 TRINITY_DN47636_c0_g1_i1:39-905(+)
MVGRALGSTSGWMARAGGAFLLVVGLVAVCRATKSTSTDATILTEMSSDGTPRRLPKLREIADPDSYEALVYEPPAAEGGRDVPLPLLLYLHGAGEMHGSLQDILSEGATGTPPVELSRGRAAKGLVDRFVVVSPHCTQGWDPSRLSKLLDYLLSKASGLHLDPTKLYVTGHSMGGAGALAAAAATHRFAAAVPVAPSGAPRATDLKGTSVWAFHGKNDVIVPSFVSEELIHMLRSAGSSEDDAKLTLYEDAPAPPGWPDYYGHASTIPAYATAELYDWLLKHQRSSA